MVTLELIDLEWTLLHGMQEASGQVRLQQNIVKAHVRIVGL